MKTQVTPRQAVFGRLSLHACRLLVRAEKSDDQRLLNLACGLGLLAADVMHGRSLQINLDRLAAYALGWAEAIIGTDAGVQVHCERDRQEQLLKAGKFTFTCASLVADDRRKLRVLIEEIGEVAEAIDLREQGKPRPLAAKENLVKEIIQVAAVCVAWLESMEAK